MSTPYSKYAASQKERTRPERIQAKPLRHPGRWATRGTRRRAR